MLSVCTLGDAMDDVIDRTTDRDARVRLSSVLSIGKLVSRNSMDKRAIVPVVDRLADVDKTVRVAALSVLGIQGWLDATVDPCIRNRAFATLIALSTKDPEPFVKQQAAKLVDAFAQLGVPDPSITVEECQRVGRPPFVPAPAPDVGPIVQPEVPAAQAVGFSLGEKVAVGIAAATLLGVGGYVMLGRSRTVT